MIKGIIFDLDGTLLDTSYDLQTAVNKIMDDYGFNHYSVKEIIDRVGNGNKKLIERCLPKDRLDLLDEAVEKFYKYYANCYLEKTIPYDGIVDLLKELNKRKILIGVNTNKFDLFCENLLKEKFEGIDFFKCIGSRDNIPNKPDPYSTNEIINEMNFNKDEVLFVGDSDVDIKTGKNAELKCIWVSWGFRSLEDIKDNEPDFKANKASDILLVIDKLNNKPIVVNPVTK